MSIKRVFKKAHPVGAALAAKDRGQSPVRAFLDPSGIILKQKATPEMIANQKKKREEEASRKAYASIGRTPPGMKHGGKVKNCCRGMGAATKGGYFKHD